MKETASFLCGANHIMRAVLLTPDEELAALVMNLWSMEQITWRIYGKGGQAVDELLTAPPDLLVVDAGLADMAATDVVTMIKGENVYRQVPVVLAVDETWLAGGVDWSAVEADDYLLRDEEDGWVADHIQARLELTLCRAARSMDTNPLSKLPGNTSIMQRIQDLIDRKAPFALAYVDLDNFKAFNDKYGFSRGDEALMMAARVIVNIVRSIKLDFSFVGHVGGDDFVFITPLDQVEDACKKLIAMFDDIVPNFYDAEDRKRGAILSKDRQGNPEEFPLMAMSIAVVMNHNAKLKHYGEASNIAGVLKKEAKRVTGSNYVLDRRED